VRPSTLDHLLLEDERQEQLLAKAFSAVDALSREGRRRLFRHLKARVEAEAEIGEGREPTKSAPAKKTAAVSSSDRDQGPTYADQAEAFVLGRPDGVTNREVADATGQDVKPTDGTLRHVARSRRTIERRGNRWFPTGAPLLPSRTTELTIREAVKKVFESNGNKPLAAQNIYREALIFKHDLKKGSLDAELVNMRAAEILTQSGTAPSGGGLYHLATGGAPTQT
jgi:hypothetical protein